jgi:RNA polymerase sigma-70 factor, ECF subfamily
MLNDTSLASLLARVAREDRQAFKDLYDRTCRHLLGVAFAVLRDRGRAEDALQEAYLSVWKNAGSFNPAIAMPMTWLITITRNKARDAARTLRSHPMVESDEGGEAVVDEVAADRRWEPEHLLELQLNHHEVSTCMASLSPSHRQALALAYFQCMPHVDIAGSLNVPLGTAKAWVRRGLERMRTCLKTVGVVPA